MSADPLAPSSAPATWTDLQFLAPILEAAGGLLAGIGTAVAIAFAAWQWTHQLNDRLKSLSAWITYNHEHKQWEVRFANATDRPVYQWRCRVRWTPDNEHDPVEVVLESTEFGTIPPTPDYWPVTWHHPPIYPTRDARVWVDFIDTRGRAWTHSPSGLIRAKGQTRKELLAL